MHTRRYTKSPGVFPPPPRPGSPATEMLKKALGDLYAVYEHMLNTFEVKTPPGTLCVLIFSSCRRVWKTLRLSPRQQKWPWKRDNNFCNNKTQTLKSHISAAGSTDYDWGILPPPQLLTVH